MEIKVNKKEFKNAIIDFLATNPTPVSDNEVTGTIYKLQYEDGFVTIQIENKDCWVRTKKGAADLYIDLR